MNTSNATANHTNTFERFTKAKRYERDDSEESTTHKDKTLATKRFDKRELWRDMP
jgi:hypothetical protein